jgi:hypothetical protein
MGCKNVNVPWNAKVMKESGLSFSKCFCRPGRTKENKK